MTIVRVPSISRARGAAKLKNRKLTSGGRYRGGGVWQSKRKIQAVVSRGRHGRQRSVNYEEGLSRVSRFARPNCLRDQCGIIGRAVFPSLRDVCYAACEIGRVYILRAPIIGIVVPAEPRSSICFRFEACPF